MNKKKSAVKIVNNRVFMAYYYATLFIILFPQA